MENKILQNDHPQKSCMNLVCNIIYYIGLGEYWYEPRKRKFKALYILWRIFVNSYFIIGLMNELGANFRTLNTEKEKTDLIQFSFAHTTIAAKCLVLYLQKNRIPKVLNYLLESDRIINVEMEKATVRKALRCCLMLIISLIFTLSSATVDGTRIYLKTGTPIRTEVVYYPTPEDTGILVNILRFTAELHWWVTVTLMCASDCLAFCALAFIEHKFKMIQLHFGAGPQKILDGGEKIAIKQQLYNSAEIKQWFIVGIKYHEDALWCARNVQYALGNLYSVQILQSITLVAICLIKFAAKDHNLSFIVANATYIICVLSLTAIYMKAGGDITYEASLVSDSIFYSGWEQMGRDKERRFLSVVAIQRSNVPVIMTAFGIVPLSYNNFITVIRYSYSFFAVMY